MEHENEIIKFKKNGDAGYRSPYLSHAKRALYHLSYIPFVLFFTIVKIYLNIIILLTSYSIRQYKDL